MLYSLGHITTDKPFVEPTKELVEKWGKEWLEKYNTDDYNVYLIGGTLEMLYGERNYESKDVDIFLMNEIIKPQELFDLMVGAVKLGFKYNLKIDIFHGDTIYTGEQFKPYYLTKFYDKWCVTNSIGEVIKGGVEEKFVVKRYDCGLITCYITEPKQSFIKHYIRSNNGTYTKNYLNLKELIFNKYL
jgi:hypothetical protein